MALENNQHNDSQKAIQKQILAYQETWRQVVESIQNLQFAPPDISHLWAKPFEHIQQVIAKQREDFAKQLEEINRALDKLPSNIKNALLLLGGMVGTWTKRCRFLNS